MINNLVVRFSVVLLSFFGFEKLCAAEIEPFFLQRQDGSVLEGYFSPPETESSPIIFAIQGSSCESSLKLHVGLSNLVNSLGLGVIVLEKQGISKDSLNEFEYNQTNCLKNRLEDYVLCLDNILVINPDWKGKIIFWGESEGGTLAATLAAQIPETAAVLLFATGGGMKPREEVEWIIRHRLQEHGAQQDEIDQYISFLNEQMEAIKIDPTPHKQFLGNTYKWWASLLDADEALTSLKQLSLPIFLVHGVEDDKIPVLSADLAAEDLRDGSAITYLRLEGYGHDLDNADVQAATCQWLQSILFGEEQPNSSPIATAIQSPVSLSLDWKTDISNYVLSRGPGRAGFAVEGRRDTEGNQCATGSLNVSKETDGGNWNMRAEAAVNQDRNGNTRGEVSVRGEWCTNF